MKSGVKISGLKELQEEMNKVVEEMKDDLQMGTDDAANAVASALRSNAPVRKGRLRDSVTTKKLPSRANLPQVTMVGCDYTTAPHQHIVEFGSVRSRPNPFFRPTIDGARGAIKSAIQNRASEPIKRRGG